MDDDLEYDPYDEGLESGDWITRNGEAINILIRSKEMCNSISMCSQFSFDEDKWSNLVSLFEHEIDIRRL